VTNDRENWLLSHALPDFAEIWEGGALWVPIDPKMVKYTSAVTPHLLITVASSRSRFEMEQRIRNLKHPLGVPMIGQYPIQT